MNYFMRFDCWGGNHPIINMQLEKAILNSIGLELNIYSYKQQDEAVYLLKSVNNLLDYNVHIRKSKELDFYFSDDIPERNKKYVESAVAFLTGTTDTGYIVHDETDPYLTTLSDSRLNSYINALKQIEPYLKNLNNKLYIEFSNTLEINYYLKLIRQISQTNMEQIGSCIDIGHVYYFYRVKQGYTKNESIEKLKQFIVDVNNTGVPMYYHVHDCDPYNPHPWYGVADHKCIGDGEIGIDGFRKIIPLLENENLNLEILPVSDYHNAILTECETKKLIAYAKKHNLDAEKQIKDGKIIKQTLDDIVKSRNILDGLVKEKH